MINWTHKKVKITDIRKVRRFYIINIDDKSIEGPLFVTTKIFEERVNSYYLRNSDVPGHDNFNITRDEVLNVQWNLVINKGYYIKIVDGQETKIEKDPDKYFVSFIEIDGPLGKHISL